MSERCEGMIWYTGSDGFGRLRCSKPVGHEGECSSSGFGRGWVQEALPGAKRDTDHE